jgi:hypothetical protein
MTRLWVGLLRAEDFPPVSKQAPRPTSPPVQWVPDALSQEIMCPGSEAYHAPPSGAEVRNEWSCTFISQIAIISCTETTLTLYEFEIYHYI